MGRPMSLKKSRVVSLQIEDELYCLIQDIASLESSHKGKVVSACQLIRDALKYVYLDNERLRECMRRSRVAVKTRY